jgi:hypothetical protein
VIRLLLVVLTVALVGCSVNRDRESEWEQRLSPAWATFERAYERGWTKGCEAANDRITDPLRVVRVAT